MSLSCDTPKPDGRADAVGVVILAAGKSGRMGKPKLLLPWGKTSVLGHLVEQWRALRVRQTAVVCAPDGQAILAELDRLGFPETNRLCNPAPDRGMFSSIQCAAQWPGWNSELTRWAIVLGDQPLVRLNTLRHVLEFSAVRPEMICQPARGGRGRHPVVLPKAAFLALGSSTATTLKEFLQARAGETACCPVDDPGLEVDIDRPEDYQRAVELALKQELNHRAIPANNGHTKYESG